MRETTGCHLRLEELRKDRLYYLTGELFEPINRRRSPDEGHRGRPPEVKSCEVLEGILHVLRTGVPCAGCAERSSQIQEIA